MSKRLSVAPSARRLTTSLRDIGYSFESAVADIVDNSIAAGATTIDIQIAFQGRDSYVIIVDNGNGMDTDRINEAMRFGSRRSYKEQELGRYGLGLKTASLSQCRRLEVISKSRNVPLEARTLDLDFIQNIDSWVTLDHSDEKEVQELFDQTGGCAGTIVVWKKLDRLLPAKSPDSGWARRRIEGLGPKLSGYLSMVFHRFLSGEAYTKVSICVNGEELEPWDPFARNEPKTQMLDVDEFEVEHGDASGTVTLKRYLLPQRDEFSSRPAFDKASGIDKWNKQQGLYIYRADRLVQWGGWSKIRTIDEHTKLARASLDFNTRLDDAFNINVAKMRVSLPSQLRKMISRPVNELCIAADAAYRRANAKKSSTKDTPDDVPSSFWGSDSGEAIGLALRTAAARTGNFDALEAISTLLKEEMPDLARHLGFD
ncbi:DNA mismatch repair protein [Corynebacterium segmentosum]|uniref:DNA mismatch repair protein n=1 Tax=Corynebacterium segmentosum TaxID=43990 RepID=A0ABY6TDC9_9CORY|nr:DNA mismatch repair protein [Corynebacterium segmentosum]